jgi:hypothetical protein
MTSSAPATVVVAWGRADDPWLLRRTVGAAIGVDVDDLTEGRLCPTCASSEHGLPWVRRTGRPAGSVSLSRHGDDAVVAWCAEAGVGVDVDEAGQDGWVAREARGKCGGTGIAGADPIHLEHRVLQAPDGCVAAVACDAADWHVVVT